MRGTDLSRGGDIMYTGITPAHAGNSLPAVCPSRILRDHPRSCGEQLKASEFCSNCVGSPPLMRGTAGPFFAGRGRYRITPAHAGNSDCQWCDRQCQKDHPRSCGEQASASKDLWNNVGSPPLMRGTAAVFRGPASRLGITPAHAGNRQFWRLLPRHS